MKFRLIDSGSNTGSMNMAIDESLLSSKLPVLRFYHWKPATLSLGYFQDTNKINKHHCKKNKIHIVRRLTGGNAVLHDKELTYSFIIDEKHMPKGTIESYGEICAGLMRGLELLGLEPEVNLEVKKQHKTAVCFHDPSYYEVLVKKRKIIGSAQKRHKGKLLQHGSILLDMDHDKYAGCFHNFSSNSLRDRVTTINNELEKKVNYDKVKKAMINGFKEAMDIDFIQSKLTFDETKQAEKLRSKYESNGFR